MQLCLSPDKSLGIIVLLNAGFDSIGSATLQFRAPPAEVRLLAPGIRPLQLKPAKAKNGWRIVLKDFAPWRVKALLLGGACHRGASLI